MKRPRALDERGPMLRVGSVAEDGTDRLPHRAGSDDPRRSRSAPTGMEIPIAGVTEPRIRLAVSRMVTELPMVVTQLFIQRPERHVCSSFFAGGRKTACISILILYINYAGLSSA